MMRALHVVIVVTVIATSAAAQDARYKAPRTESGHPDLQGVWNFNSDVPLERPAAFADKKFFTPEELQQQNVAREHMLDAVAQRAPVDIDRLWLDYRAKAENLQTSLVVYPENGRLPPLVDGVQRVGGFTALNNDIKGTRPVRFLFGGISKDGPEDRGVAERCLAGGHTVPPFVPRYEHNYIEIVQSRDHVAVRIDGIGNVRLIPLDGRPRLGDTLRSWSGDSRGRWEGETLVVETRNFNGLTQSFADAGTSHHKVVVERFTRVSRTTLRYEATLVDPATFQDRIVLSFPMARVDVPLYEFACHEGNRSLAHTLAAARKEEDAKRPTR
jgi:hypothetical protein